MASSASQSSRSSVSDSDAPITRKPPVLTFRFFDLPAELRRYILKFLLVQDRVIDIDARVHGLLARTLLVSRQFCEEAANVFYGCNTFRIMPTHHRAAGRFARPILQDLSQWHRSRMTSLELRLGPFWANPPKSWRRGITKRMGLEQVTSLRVLKVFVEVDPSHPIFTGFRNTQLPYHDFCASLLEQVLRRLPSVEEVCFDAYKSASRGMLLIDTLVELAKRHEKRISWGPYQREIDAENERKPSHSVDAESLTNMMAAFTLPNTTELRKLPKSFFA